MSAFRRAYGAGPLHLAAVVASLAVGAYALARVLDLVSDPSRVVLWLVAAVVLHDLLLLPLYALAGRVAGRAIVPPGRRTRLRIAVLNHLRVPALLSGLALLVWYPLVAAKAPRGYERSSGLDVGVYMDRWVGLTLVMFCLSALVLLARIPLLRRDS